MKNKTKTILIIIGFISAVVSLFLVPLLFGTIAVILCIIALVKDSKTKGLPNAKKWLAYVSIVLAIISIVYAFLIVKKQITGLTNNVRQEVNTSVIKARDAKRLADAKILSTTIQLYALDTNTLPIIKDSAGNFKIWKLAKNSADFTQLLSILKRADSTLDIPIDPLNPERYYEYYSNGKKYTISVFFENNNTKNCQLVKKNYCKYEITGSLAQVINQ